MKARLTMRLPEAAEQRLLYSKQTTKTTSLSQFLRFGACRGVRVSGLTTVELLRIWQFW